MQRVVLLLPCLACGGHGQLVHGSNNQRHGTASPMETLARLLVSLDAAGGFSPSALKASSARGNPIGSQVRSAANPTVLPETLRAYQISASTGQEQFPATVEIEYCVGCRWLLRAAWLAQELLTTFAVSGETPILGKVALVPNTDGGVFKVRVNEAEIWDRKRDGGFPEAKVLKQLVRDQVSPQKDLGHSDKK